MDPLVSVIIISYNEKKYILDAISSVVSQSYKNIEIVAGTNLPMLAEVVMARQFGMDLESLVNTALNTGKDQIIRFELAPVEETVENDDFSDGI